MNYVEKLSKENLSDLYEIGQAFTAEVNYPGGFVFGEFNDTWEMILGLNMGEIFVVRENGKVIAALGCSFVKDGFNGRLTAAESWWFVHKEHRGSKIASALFNAFEGEAIRRDCKKIIMARLETPQAEQLDALYLKRGYRPIEKTFGKEV